MRVLLVRLGWALAALLLLVAVLKSTVADVFRVGSRSMRPTVFGGADPGSEEAFDEHVLVRFADGDDLARFDLAVVRRGAETPVIKRVAGLPGESVGISGGDLIVDGARLPLAAPRPAPIPVFDDALQDVRELFLLRTAPDGPWSSAGAEWRLDARAVPPGAGAGLMLYREELRDDYLDPHGGRVAGRREVNDARLECEVRLEEPAGFLCFRLVEAGDTFEARVAPRADGAAEATLVRFNSRSLQSLGAAADRVEVLARGPVDLPAGAWVRIAFENVDNHLILDVGGQRLSTTYAANEPHAGPTPSGAASLGPRAALGGEGCLARFRGIRILRDIFYASLGTHGVQRPLALGPDELFVLGDNSGDSRDSRMFGPVPASDVIGRPTHIVWPLDRARALPEAIPR